MTHNTNQQLNTNQKIILYLIQELGDKVEGKKKIMKLMFLIQHYDFENDKIVADPHFPNTDIAKDFEIYLYGVFSDMVQKDLKDLVINLDKVENTYPLKIRGDVDNNIGFSNPNLKEQIDKVIEEWGKKYTGYRLEITTLQMLGLGLATKERYKGWSIEKVMEVMRYYIQHTEGSFVNIDPQENSKVSFSRETRSIFSTQEGAEQWLGGWLKNNSKYKKDDFKVKAFLS